MQTSFIQANQTQKTNQNTHSASVPHIWNQLNVTISSEFQMFATNWIVYVLTSSGYLILIEGYHIRTVSDVWYQLNGISFNQFQISNTNWRVPYLLNVGCLFSIEWCHILTSSRHVIPIEWYLILSVPNVCYQLNGISFNHFHIGDTNWMIP